MKQTDLWGSFSINHQTVCAIGIVMILFGKPKDIFDTGSMGMSTEGRKEDRIVNSVV